MHISKKYTAADWQALTFKCEEDWEKGIRIFTERINGRFLNFVNKIKDDPYAGFAVMALDCLLIETLQQFRKGKGKTPPSQSGKYFKDFLTETSFKRFFDTEKANLFYKVIRCGILHQAEIKEDSRISINPDIPLVQRTNQRGLIINRVLFHEQLEKVFEEYKKDLHDPSNSELREKFRKKMDCICHVGEQL